MPLAVSGLPVGNLSIGNLPVGILGDPHLGRRFVAGVPLHRRGEREATQWADFEAALAGAGSARLHVCLGDLFDRFVVPPETVLRAAVLYRSAARAAPGTVFAVLRGNHDAARDADRRSSFDLFAALVADLPNLAVVAGEPQVLEIEGRLFGFVPWHPFRPAAALAETLPPGPLDAVFGHWDTESFGGDEFNLVPAGALASRTALAVTGHVHQPQELAFGGLRVLVPGSMQPYAHGEDPTGRLYRTLTLDEIAGQDLHDVCLRLLLRPGEEVPEDLDCLQLTVRRVDPGAGDAGDRAALDVELDAFDVEALFRDAMAEQGVGDAVRAEVWERFRERRGEAEAS